MVEAERRKELDLPPRKKEDEINMNIIFHGLQLLNQNKKKYPYMGVATMALGAIIFLVSGGANSIK